MCNIEKKGEKIKVVSLVLKARNGAMLEEGNFKADGNVLCTSFRGTFPTTTTPFTLRRIRF